MAYERHLRIRRASSVALALTLALAACPAETPPPVASPPPGTEAPARGGTLRVLMAGDVDALDPHLASTPSGWFFARAMHRGLLAYPSAPHPAGARPVADLAESWSASDDGRRYTFVLRDDVAFGDGRAVAATDVVESLARAIAAGTGVAPWLDVIRGAEPVRRAGRGIPEGIAAPDERTVVITLARPSTDLPWILAHPQLAVLPADAPSPGRVAPARLVGAGPYSLERYEPQRSIVLRRRPRWGADPVRGAYVERIEATIGVPAGEAERRVAAGEADLVLDPGPPDAPAPPPPARARTIEALGGCVRYLFMDPTRAPFGTRAFRAAVAADLLRDAVARASGGRGLPAGLLPPTVAGHDDDLVLETRPPPLVARRATLVIADAPRDRAEARAIARALRDRLRLTIQAVPPALLRARYAAGVPMGLATWCADWPGLAARNVLGAIARPRAARALGVRVPVPTRAIEAAARAPIGLAADRWAAVDAAIAEAAVAVPLAYPLVRTVVADRLRGAVATPMFPRGDPAGLWLEGR